MRGARLKLGVWLIAVVLALWLLYPSFQLYVVMPRQQKALREKLAAAVSADDSARAQVEISVFNKHKAGLYEKRIVHLGLDLVGGMHLVLDVDRTNMTDEQARQASENALMVIRNRIDQFGVFEPTIQRTEGGRIVVQLPGVDRDRALNIIRQQAYLTFNLVEDQAKAYDALKSIDDFLERTGAGDTIVQAAVVADTGMATPPEEGSLLSFIQIDDRGDLTLAPVDTAAFRRRLEAGRAAWPQNMEFLFGAAEQKQSQAGRHVPVYLVKSQPELEGAKLKRAQPSIYRGNEMSQANTWVVDFELDREGAAQFARVTSRNVGRRLAIVLDGVVRSAPQIKEPIPNGRGQITTGDRKGDQSKDLATVLNSGALPARLVVEEERSIGASLGGDAIRRGLLAGAIGALAVILFMMLYYGTGGVLADFALVLNIVFLMAALAALRATLTLPGIAGIALTIGMAVDANVLVFERIREEVRAGKTPMAAVDTGYERAFITIIDANATTIITAIALYFVGSGPVKGFAITLTAGLVINVLTAVLLTRFIFDWYLSRFEVRQLKV